MDKPVFGVPRSLRTAAGPAHFADGDDGGGDGSSDQTGDEGGDDTSSSDDLPPHLDPTQLVAEHGDAQRALGALSQKTEQLESETKELREERRKLRDQVPGDGDVLIDAERVEELREDGFLDTEDPTSDDIIRALQREREGRRTLEKKQKFNRVVELTDAHRGVLEDIGADTLDYQLEEVEAADGTTEVEVRVNTDEGPQEFTQYIQNEYPNLADTILSGGSSGSASSEGSGGTYVPAQPGSGGSSSEEGGAPTSADEFVEQENERRGRA